MASKARGSADAAEDGPQEEELDALGRKVWDKDYFMEKAKNNIMFGPERIGRRKDPVIPLPSSQRSFLKQRSADLELDKDLGKMKVVTAHTIRPLQGGYWCSVCECLIKDSSAYLEHVNGRRHNRNLGMNMKVEKVGIDRVREKLKAMRKEPEAVDPADIAAKLKALEEMEAEKKRRKKEKRKKKKRGGGAAEGAAEGADVDGGDDSEDGGVTGGEDEEPAGKRAKKGGEDGAQEESEEDEETALLKQMGLPTGFA